MTVQHKTQIEYDFTGKFSTAEQRGKTMALNVCVANGTFLGAPDHPERKPTFVIMTEEWVFAGPSMAECRRMLQEKQDNTTIHFAGEAPPTIVKNIGDYFERSGLGFIFG